MPQVDDQALQAASEATRRYCRAFEDHDIESFMATLSPDVVLHSPFTARTQFRGHEDMRTLLRAHFASIEDLKFFQDIGDASTRALFYRARVGSQELEAASLVHLDEQALITEIRLWFRTLPGMTAAMAKLGTALAREHGRARATATAVLATPLASVIRVSDALGVWLARPGH